VRTTVLAPAIHKSDFTKATAKKQRESHK